MKLLVTILFPLMCFSQKDSTQKLIFSGNGAHNGTCCGAWSDSMIEHWSYKRKEWSLFSDSAFDAYPGKINLIPDTTYYDESSEPDWGSPGDLHFEDVSVPYHKHTSFITKNDAIIYAIQFISGAVEGIHDYAYYHPDAFLKAHPRLNSDWWNNAESWDNKYHNTWFVRTFAVWATDANHAGKAINHLCNSVTLAIAFNDFKNWKQILKRTAIAYAVNRIGFNILYK